MALDVFGAATGASPIDATLSGNPATGSTLFALVGSSTAGSTVTSVVLDPAGVNQSFTAIFESEGGANDPVFTLWRLANVSAGAGTTVRATTSINSHLCVIGFTNMPATYAEEGNENAVNQAAATASDTGAGITTTVPGCVCFAATQIDGNSGTVTDCKIGGVDAPSEPLVSTTRSFAWYRIISATGTLDATSAWSTSNGWSSGLVIAQEVQAATQNLPPPGKVVIPDPGWMAY